MDRTEMDFLNLYVLSISKPLFILIVFSFNGSQVDTTTLIRPLNRPILFSSHHLKLREGNHNYNNNSGQETSCGWINCDYF